MHFSTNLKDPKQINNYVKEAMESASYESSTGDQNTVYEEFIPD